MIRVILLGLPGAGKSTQSARLARHYSVPVVSAGALLREEVRRGTDIGRQVAGYLQRGELAPNHLVDLLVFGRLGGHDCGGGFVLDGFPRTLEQSRSLDLFMQQMGWRLSKVIFLAVPDAVIVSRLNMRRVCPICGASYSLACPPLAGESCYACHSPLRCLGKDTIECQACGVPFVLREDDTPAVMGRRLKIQKKVVAEVLSHYGEFGVIVEIDGNRKPEEVFESIRILLDGKQQQVGGPR